MTESAWKYPASAPHRQGYLKVSDQPLHEIYWEEHGNPKGEPVLFLHGGPGAGASPKVARFFDPEHYRVIIFDQRGAKRSRPYASLENNTTPDLINDIDKLRAELGMPGKMHVFGGSWGSTLALAYAIAHPQKVKSLILRGIFLCRRKDIDIFYQGDAADPGNETLMGTGRFFPDEWARFVALAPDNERTDMVAAYQKMFLSPDAKIRDTAINSWNYWETSTSYLIQDPAKFSEPAEVSMALIECHYFMHGGFLGGTSRDQNYILNHISRIKDIPCHIVQGRYDMVCPRNQADDLVYAWNAVQPDPDRRPVLHIIETAGHSAFEPGTTRKLTEIMDLLKQHT